MSPVRANIAANIVGQAWAVLLSLACTPFYIALLGVEAYGLIAFFLVGQTFLQLLDFGLAGTINRELARSRGERSSQLADLLASAQAWYWLVGIILAVLLFVGLPAATRWWLNPDRIDSAELSNAARAFSILLLVQWPAGFYASALAGLQKQVAANAIQIPFAALSSVGGVILIWLGPRSVAALLLWQAAAAALQVVFFRTYFRAQVGDMFSTGRRRLAAFRGVWRFSLGMSAISFTGVAITHLDKIVLGRLLPLEMLGYYSLANTVARGLYVIVTPVFAAYYPRLSALVAKADAAAVEQAYRAASQVMAVLVVPLAAVLAFFPAQMLALWLRDIQVATIAAPLASLLVLGTCLNALMNVPFALQLAHGNTRIGLTINLLVLTLLVPALLFAAARFGAAGAAGMWALSNALYLAIGIPVTHRTLLKGGIWKWAREDILPPVLAALAVVAIARWIAPASLRGAGAAFVLFLAWIGATLAAMCAASAVRAWGRQVLRGYSR